MTSMHTISCHSIWAIFCTHVVGKQWTSPTKYEWKCETLNRIVNKTRKLMLT